MLGRSHCNHYMGMKMKMTNKEIYDKIDEIQ